MQNIINLHDIIKQLAKNGLQINDKGVLSYHIKNFNYNTFIYGYSGPFYSNKVNRIYDRDATSNEMINLYKFDRDMANHILRFILVIEKIINTNVAYEVINHYNLRDKCLLKLDMRFLDKQVLSNLRDVEPKISFNNFIKKLIKYLPTSPITKQYVKKNTCDEIIRWRDCPMDVMCLTWSFATTFSFFIALADDARNRVLSNFGLTPNFFSGFIAFLKNTLHLRNYISHNNVIYNTPISYQCPSLLSLYEFIFKKPVTQIKLSHMMELIEFFSHSATLVSNTKYYFNKLKIQQKFKDKIDLFEQPHNEQTTV